MPIKNVFKSRLPSCKYIFGSEGINGKEANFINYEYYTDNKVEIEELEREIALNSNHMYIDENKLTIDTDSNPLEEIKKQAVAEYLAKQAAAMDPERDSGETDKTKSLLAGIATSRSVAKQVESSNSSNNKPG